MRRILLDTNIYGLIVEKQEREDFLELISKTKVIIYGCSIVRKELRNTPKKIVILTADGLRKVRNLLLELYDAVTGEHSFIVDEETERLADKYLKQFTKLTGQTVVVHLKIDFTLVACATLKNLDLIVSEDHKTLLSPKAIASYQLVNAEEGLKLPPIMRYAQLKTVLKRWLSV